jgi:hypothetical protein
LDGNLILFDTVKAYSDFPAGIVANESCGSIRAAGAAGRCWAFDFLIFLFSCGISSPKAAAAHGIAVALIERRAARLLHRALCWIYPEGRHSYS